MVSNAMIMAAMFAIVNRTFDVIIQIDEACVCGMGLGQIGTRESFFFSLFKISSHLFVDIFSALEMELRIEIGR